MLGSLVNQRAGGIVARAPARWWPRRRVDGDLRRSGVGVQLLSGRPLRRAVGSAPAASRDRAAQRPDVRPVRALPRRACGRDRRPPSKSAVARRESPAPNRPAAVWRDAGSPPAAALRSSAPAWSRPHPHEQAPTAPATGSDQPTARTPSPPPAAATHPEARSNRRPARCARHPSRPRLRLRLRCCRGRSADFGESPTQHDRQHICVDAQTLVVSNQ